jgi:hypothetical protein
MDELQQAKSSFWSDHVTSYFSVSIQDRAGRFSKTDYVGIPGRRLKVMDALGRLRPKTINPSP